MSSIQTFEAGQVTIPTLNTNSIFLTNQGTAPAADGNLQLYSNADTNLVIGGSVISGTSLTAARNYTLSTTATDQLVLLNSTATLENSTYSDGVNGNVIAANQLNGVTITGTPAANTALIVTVANTTAAWTDIQETKGCMFMSPYQVTSSATTPTVVTGGNLLWPGSARLTFAAFRFRIGAYSSGTITVRIQNITNGTTIASGTATAVGNFLVTTFNNVPVGLVRLQVQASNSVAVSFTLDSWTIQFT